MYTCISIDPITGYCIDVIVLSAILFSVLLDSSQESYHDISCKDIYTMHLEQ